MASFVFAWMQIKKWKRNPRVICAFLVLLLLCLTMTSEYVDYSKEIGLSIQVFEPFILMFTQRYSLLFIMPILLLLFALLVCVLSGFSVGYFQNIWSDTAWFTAYGGALNESAPIEITLIENLNPYVSVACIMALFFFGTLALNTILFSLNLWKGKFVGLCVVASLIFMGYLFSADLILKEWSGWLSIACHVNLAQHQLTGTGSDPKIGQSILLLLSISLCSFAWTCKLAKNFNFFIGEKE